MHEIPGLCTLGANKQQHMFGSLARRVWLTAEKVSPESLFHLYTGANYSQRHSTPFDRSHVSKPVGVPGCLRWWNMESRTWHWLVASPPCLQPPHWAGQSGLASSTLFRPVTCQDINFMLVWTLLRHINNRKKMSQLSKLQHKSHFKRRYDDDEWWFVLTGKDLIDQTISLFSGTHFTLPTVVLNLGESASVGTGMWISTLLAVERLLNWLLAWDEKQAGPV